MWPLLSEVNRRAVVAAELLADEELADEDVRDVRSLVRREWKVKLNDSIVRHCYDLCGAAMSAISGRYDSPRDILSNMNGFFGLQTARAHHAGRSWEEIQEAWIVDSLWTSDLVRDIFGNPFVSISPHRCLFGNSAVTLANTIYNEHRFDLLPVLADILQESGCDEEKILDHCRNETVHSRGCWLVDLMLNLDVHGA